jgi:hypothetical protein
MGNFAKVFDLENEEQVLVVLGFDNEEDKHEVKLTTEMVGVSISMSIGCEKEEQAQKIFDEYTIENAQEFRKNMDSMYNEASEETDEEE